MPDHRGAVAEAFADRVREREDRMLSPLAVRSYGTAGRSEPEPECRLRTPFQRDRDRIVHCKSFRRLKHKTQVFIAPEGDHFRTRMTHTLEAAGIARTVARALALNEDLTEAIALGHDLGHPPFGHNGEDALDAALAERFGRRFLHNEHSLRIVETLEGGGGGLNLTHEVRDGILHHTGDDEPATLEGKIVRLVDRVAYLNHDVDDAVRAGILIPGDLPAHVVDTLGTTGSARIDTLVHDIVETSWGLDDVRQSPAIGQAMLDLRAFMFERVYLGSFGSAERDRAIACVHAIFDHYLDHPAELPAGRPGDLVERVTDYVAGMTDRFALRFEARAA